MTIITQYLLPATLALLMLSVVTIVGGVAQATDGYTLSSQVVIAVK